MPHVAISLNEHVDGAICRAGASRPFDFGPCGAYAQGDKVVERQFHSMSMGTQDKEQQDRHCMNGANQDER